MHVFPKFHRKTCSDPQPFLPVDLPLLLFGLPPSYQRNKHCGTNSVLVLIIWRAEEGVWFGEQKKEPSRDEKFAEMCKPLLYWMISVKIPDWINTSLTITSNLPSKANFVWKVKMSGQVMMNKLQWCAPPFPPNTFQSLDTSPLVQTSRLEEGRGSIIIFPRSMRFKIPFKP